jgi:iron complex outermembrane receptor protein
VWTYELGGKATSADGRWLVSSAVYYNDYEDFIGQNALAIGPGGGLVSIDLNLGDVESYGLETEVVASLNDYWKLSGSVTLMHARITDQSGWLAVTGTSLATDRLLFQPDWNASLSSDVTVPVGMGDVSWNLGVVGKGSRPGSSFDPTTPSMLESYTIVNTSVTYRRNGFSASVFANNLFDEEYFESYIDGSLLQALGLLNQDLGILGTPQKVGVRLQYEF